MLMATCSKDGYAKLWTMDDYECIKELLGGKRLSTLDFCLFLWQVQDGQTLERRLHLATLQRRGAQYASIVSAVSSGISI